MTDISNYNTISITWITPLLAMLSVSMMFPTARL